MTALSRALPRAFLLTVALVLGLVLPVWATGPRLGLGVDVTHHRHSAAAFTPSQLATPPVFQFDTAAPGTVLVDLDGGPSSDGGVKEITDSRAGFSDVLTATGTVEPVLAASPTLAGRQPLVLAHASSTKMTSGDSGALNSAPWYIGIVGQFSTTPAFGLLASIGGTQSGTTPAQGLLGTSSNKLWLGYLDVTQTGYGFSIGRSLLDTSGPHFYLAAFDANGTARSWVDGAQQTQIDGATWHTASKQLTIGGEFYAGFGQCPNADIYAGFYGYNGAPSWAEVNELGSWAANTFGLGLPRTAIVQGTSIDLGYQASGNTTPWISLAAAAAAKTWRVLNYSAVGAGAGWVTGQNTIADSNTNGHGTWLLGVPTGTIASPGALTMGLYSSTWDISGQATRNAYFVGTLATNDLYFCATAAQAYFSSQIVSAAALARGAVVIVDTLLPRQDTGLCAGFEAQRQAYNATVAASWSVALRAARITGATNASPIVLTTEAPHPFVSGDSVNVELVFGNGAANNAIGSPWTVTVVDATHFALNGSAGSGAWTGGGVAFSGTGLGASYFSDFAGIPTMSDPTNASYFNTDKVHPTPAGHTQLATVNGTATGSQTPVAILNAMQSVSPTPELLAALLAAFWNRRRPRRRRPLERSA